MMIPGNYYRYFVIERKFRLTLLVFALLGCVLVYQFHTIQMKREEIKSEMDRQQLVMRIPAMEMEMNRRMPKKKIVPPPVAEAAHPEPSFEERNVLKGTIDMEGTQYAVINDAQYKVGDVIDEYVILKIEIGSVQLINSKTQEIKELH